MCKPLSLSLSLSLSLCCFMAFTTRWYPSLAAFTFPSYFIPLNMKEAVALKYYYATRLNVRRDRDLTPFDVAVLKNLESRIDQVLKENFSDTGAFMRLCGRSPKDGDPLDGDAVWRRYSHRILYYTQSHAHLSLVISYEK